MKNIFILSLLCYAFTIVSCFAQQCGQSLGQFFDELKTITERSYKEPPYKLSYEEYSSFDFITFKPIDDKISDTLQYVQVGYDLKKNVKELIFHSLNEVYSLLIYDFTDHRILLLKRKDAFGEWMFTPTAIRTSKDGNYMINVHSLFDGDYNYYKLFKYFPITTFEKISCLMDLREDLYPKRFVKFSNGKIVTYSGLGYEFEKSCKLEFEGVYFFIDPEHHNFNLTIDRNSCMKEIMERSIELTIKSNLRIFTSPDIFKETIAPIWIFCGDHSYILKNKQN
ncbi:MAG TPA: hypothetical protein VIN08_16655 [Ohtaekwangia sp.]|uniref:hypothetical protein n=1 Tax=Ohtaekwangia sp. TaxID=2066019 RepID=UPI002F954D67